MFNTWIVILASVQPNLKRKKKLLLLISLILLQLKGNPGKHLPKEKTGVLESIEREEAADLIKRYGGKVTQSVSKKTSYFMGWDPGESKLSKENQVCYGWTNIGLTQ
ncbi:unnamed protein product [Pocillopora meandrina]|uniref:BRCT domain-containing protein n=1 Tax=Pocillopora meandrina TaxID=46732 RepID=A0AAU9Y5I3_9CNID|nr:unnamed protein product [Pocillopora meandrina]